MLTSITALPLTCQLICGSPLSIAALRNLHCTGAGFAIQRDKKEIQEPSSLYQTFPPEEARRLLEKFVTK